MQNVILPPVMKRDFHADWQESVKFYTETSEMEGGDRVSHNYSADKVVRDEHAHLYLSQLVLLLFFQKLIFLLFFNCFDLIEFKLSLSFSFVCLFF